METKRHRTQYTHTDTVFHTGTEQTFICTDAIEMTNWTHWPSKRERFQVTLLFAQAGVEKWTTGTFSGSSKYFFSTDTQEETFL